ncbi:hypothetical protein Pan44_53790 [Caulifigura coniformis]|uniref:Uncharacterized protein n=1 Tax=Caulifigura coniformis TaxID=2527983 RepID=A0A517SMG0_9PLAN|nr:hypothetical protein Pan44_53790 [Caulifigura coniformis]
MNCPKQELAAERPRAIGHERHDIASVVSFQRKAEAAVRVLFGLNGSWLPTLDWSEMEELALHSLIKGGLAQARLSFHLLNPPEKGGPRSISFIASGEPVTEFVKNTLLISADRFGVPSDRIHWTWRDCELRLTAIGEEIVERHRLIGAADWCVLGTQLLDVCETRSTSYFWENSAEVDVLSAAEEPGPDAKSRLSKTAHSPTGHARRPHESTGQSLSESASFALSPPARPVPPRIPHEITPITDLLQEQLGTLDCLTPLSKAILRLYCDAPENIFLSSSDVAIRVASTIVRTADAVRADPVWKAKQAVNKLEKSRRSNRLRENAHLTDFTSSTSRRS